MSCPLPAPTGSLEEPVAMASWWAAGTGVPVQKLCQSPQGLSIGRTCAELQGSGTFTHQRKRRDTRASL